MKEAQFKQGANTAVFYRAFKDYFIRPGSCICKLYPGLSIFVKSKPTSTRYFSSERKDMEQMASICDHG